MPTINQSNVTKSWRLIHDGKKVLALFESSGITSTIHTLFCGTEAQARAEAARLKLEPLPPGQERPKRAQ